MGIVHARLFHPRQEARGPGRDSPHHSLSTGLLAMPSE